MYYDSNSYPNVCFSLHLEYNFLKFLRPQLETGVYIEVYNINKNVLFLS